MNNFFIIAIIVIALIIYTFFNSSVEGFDGRYGWNCFTCSGKTINQCYDCANCGFCLDKNGNGKCIPGDIHGPHDKKIHCSMWYHSDPYSRMLWYNKWKRNKPYVE